MDVDTTGLELRSIYREPSAGAVDKVTGEVGEKAASFISHAPLFVIASTDGSGVDASPRGGPPGFVQVLDDHTLAFADLTGNNRLDTYTNVATVPSVGCIFLVPGAEETLRVNGTASISTDEELRRRCAIGDRLPKVVVLIHVAECYLHCGAALRRAALWDPDTWLDPEDRATGGEILAEAIESPVPPAEIDKGLAEYYDNWVWEVGGASEDG